MPDQPVHLVYGPTASGKSACALELAAAHDGVIINADSMQVYDALPILTAQPTAADKAAAPHRLYGALPAAQQCSAARWRGLAVAEIEAALAAGKTPIVCGGTGFYLKTLIDGLSPIPDVPVEIRRMTVELQSELGNPGFHGELLKRDPDIARKLNPHDTQRLIRAWEILEATGKSLAYWQSLPAESAPAHWRFEYHAINPARDDLHRRIDARFDAMIADGALDEVRTLDEQIVAGTIPADAGIIIAHGFRPLRSHLYGRATLAEAIEQSKLETRQYAKRQQTWFRHQMPA